MIKKMGSSHILILLKTTVLHCDVLILNNSQIYENTDESPEKS